VGTTAEVGIESRNCSAGVRVKLLTVGRVERLSKVEVTLLGATGRVEQNVPRTYVSHNDVQGVRKLGRNATEQWHEKLQEIEDRARKPDSPIFWNRDWWFMESMVLTPVFCE
jgi:hypothetical protein